VIIFENDNIVNNGSWWQCLISFITFQPHQGTEENSSRVRNRSTIPLQQVVIRADQHSENLQADEPDRAGRIWHRKSLLGALSREQQPRSEKVCV
jgi:hypothetical protein